MGGKTLYDLSECGKCRLFARQMTDDILAGDDPDEAVQVIHHGDEVLTDDAVQELVQGGGDADGGVFPEDIPDVEPLQFLDGEIGCAFVGKEPPEEISLADSAHILSPAVDDGDGAAPVVPELLQPLAQGVVVVEVGDTVFGGQQISNIHSRASFLLRRGSPPGSRLVVRGTVSIIYRKAEGK